MKPGDIQTYYEESFQFLQQRKKRQAEQLKLLSNLRRGDANISSTLMLTLFDRIMAGLYDDKLQVKFLPSQGLTQRQINAYNILYQSDYQEMGKAKLDYDWCWDTLFFGRGYMETVRFDIKKKIMQPHVINPLNFFYDPFAEEVQNWRYYAKWLSKTKYELQMLKRGGALKPGFELDTIAPSIDPYLWEYKVVRDQARDGIAPAMDPVSPDQKGTTDIYQILEFYAHNEQGNKCVYWIDRNFSQIIYEKELDFSDGEEIIMPDGQGVKAGSRWPIVCKEAFRIPHQAIPLSVADLLEDKHRAKSVLLNLAFIAAKDEANPVYWYNDQVEDASAFLSRQLNQHIKITGDGATAVGPINKSPVMSPELMNFINMLTQEANEPVGTGQALEPNSTSETATKTAIDQQLNDLAQSLQSKVMQFGESEFCSHWFHRYAKHAKELKEKTANIIGVKGVDSQIISLDVFQADFPPGVFVFSAKEAEYKNLVKRRDWMQILPILPQTGIDADGMRNFYKHVFMPLMIEDPATIDVMLPKTLDEIKAEDENERLAQNEFIEAQETDNHTTHIYTHRMIPNKTWAMWFHIDMHEKMLAEQKKQEQLAQQQQLQDTMQSASGKPQFGKEKSNPKSAASPLKSELVSDLNK